VTEERLETCTEVERERESERENLRLEHKIERTHHLQEQFLL
jgi:hypothetical protein